MKKNISRRKFVKTTLATTAAVSVAPTLSMCNSGPRKNFDAKGLPTRKLGKVGIEVPLIGCGLGSRWMSNETNDEGLAVLEHALNNGLYYWDTAARYGNDDISSEERVGILLPSVRDRVFLVTKVEERTADEARATIERSLKRLNTDYIDMLFVHSIKSVEDAESLGRKGMLLEAMHQFRDEGIVRHIGFSGHASAEGNKRAADLYDFEAMMIAMNHYHEKKDQPFEEEAGPYIARNGLGVVAMKTVRPVETVGGLDFDKLIRYALSLEHISIANIGMETRELVDNNLAIIRDFQALRPDEMAEMKARLTPFFQGRNLPWMQPGYQDGSMKGLHLA